MVRSHGELSAAYVNVPRGDQVFPDGRPPQKITFAEMRAAGVRGVLIYCRDYRCSQWTRLDADRWSDHVRLSNVETGLVCTGCGKRGADVRPDFNWARKSVEMMGYR